MIAALAAAAVVCTTNVTVVSRGDDVVSTTVTSRTCEPAAQASPPRSCVQTTTLVSRDEVVVSAGSTLKCAEGSAASAGIAGAPKAVLGAPAGAASLVGKALTAGGKDAVTLRGAQGYWRVVDESTPRICRLVLSTQADPAGFAVRRTDCKGTMATIQAWTFDDGAVSLRAKGGALVVRLGGTRERLEGRSGAGEDVALVR
jgi:hypothetical protein